MLNAELRFPCSAQRLVASDNCHADKAVANAKQFADLLSRSDLVGVVKPG
jgi:hypothetical protein